MRSCDKAFYIDQATARLALAKIGEKAAAKGKPVRLPVRVYPCDACDGWHLTAKPTSKAPPWDRDPGWVRPGGTAHLEQRSKDVITGGTKRQRKRARRSE